MRIPLATAIPHEASASSSPGLLLEINAGTGVRQEALGRLILRGFLCSLWNSRHWYHRMKIPNACDPSPPVLSEHYRRVLHNRRQSLLADLDRVPHGRAPYDLEIGCGHGHFLSGYAAAHPERYCIGIDIAGGRLERARRKTDRAGLDNVAWIQTEAQLFLECLPEAIRFSRVFILFPDPWPKKRHHKNRLVNLDFLDRLANACTPAAELYFRSDHFPYVDAAEKALIAGDGWKLRYDADWPWEQPSVFQDLAHDYRSLIATRA